MLLRPYSKIFLKSYEYFEMLFFLSTEITNIQFIDSGDYIENID